MVARAPTTTAKARFDVDGEYLDTFVDPEVKVKEYAFDYNPKELSISGGAKWKAADGNKSDGVPKVEFVEPNPRKVKLKLFLDAYGQEGGDVSKKVAILFDWTRPRKDKSGQNLSAPFLRFQWGQVKNFKCVITSLGVTYTLFSVEGTPLRGTVDVSLEEAFDLPWFTNPTSGGEGGERRHVVVVGDTLHSIADRLYGHPRFWRGLAAFNGLDDPFRLLPGHRLAAPPLDDIAPLS